MPISNAVTKKFPEAEKARLASRFYLSILLFTLLTACASDEGTPEDQIHDYIHQGIAAAEARDHSALADLIHADYSGERIINKQQLVATARAWFFRHKHIHLLSKIERIELTGDKRAYVVVYFAMAGQAISSASALTSLRAKVFRFELEIEKQDEWLLRRARWKQATLDDML